MKQRTRIRRIKDRMYPGYIYAARQRRWWADINARMRSLSEAMREVYEKARVEL